MVFGTTAAILIEARLGTRIAEEAVLLAGALVGIGVAYWLKTPVVLIVGLIGVLGGVISYLERWLPSGYDPALVALVAPTLIGLCYYALGRLVEPPEGAERWRRRFASVVLARWHPDRGRGAVHRLVRRPALRTSDVDSGRG